MEAMFSLIVLLLFISPTCYGTLEISGDELLLKTHGTVHTRRVRDTDNKNLEKHHVDLRRPGKQEPLDNNSIIFRCTAGQLVRRVDTDDVMKPSLSQSVEKIHNIIFLYHSIPFFVITSLR
ncbi:unnamed protein product [Brugia pahangi]|uniref:Uncharacterized protein n=1 Tax=Brugia pahangi TaxID=6280 RepID=A0A158PQL9_BRUPA|nr:unnamed protein product [Brugia pahangi]